MTPDRVLLPEWHRQWGVLIAWPDRETDWAPLLEQVEPVYRELSRAIAAREQLLILCRDAGHQAHIREQLRTVGVNEGSVRFRELPFDDTWTRDYGPLAVQTRQGLELQEFIFNGWGGKYDAHRDNRIPRQLPWQVPLHSHPLVLEGGAVDTDGRGTLLTTDSCLAHPGRNPRLNRSDMDARLREYLDVTEVIRLKHGALEGDDTDGHVDMLARFCGPSTLAYVQCTDEDDTHYSELRALEDELTHLAEARNWHLTPLPLPPALHNDQGRRLPATYANFLIINDAVLMPAYGTTSDDEAQQRLREAFPERTVEPVYCRPLLEQGGSLHCATLQLPEGVI